MTFLADDFRPPLPGDRVLALAAVIDAECDPPREEICHGYVNCCRCEICTLPPRQRRLRARVRLADERAAA